MYTPHHPGLQDRMAKLRERVADRPKHAAFLAWLEEMILAADGDADAAADMIADGIDEAVARTGVSFKVADALEDDVTWILYRDAGQDNTAARDAYDELRIKDARAAGKRAQTRDSLEYLLKPRGRA